VNFYGFARKIAAPEPDRPDSMPSGWAVAATLSILETNPALRKKSRRAKDVAARYRRSCPENGV
jgi:hypothetical protein